MNEDESGLMNRISTDEDEYITTERRSGGLEGEDKTDSIKDAKRVSTATLRRTREAA